MHVVKDFLKIYLRFINLVENSSLEKKVLLSYIKHLRIEYLIKNSDLTCEKAFIPLQNIFNNFDSLSQMVGVQSRQESKNSSRSNINFGSEMFIYLNSCPSINVKLYWKAIYESDSSKIAKFTSNIIRKAKDDFRVKAQKIFAKISSVIGKLSKKQDKD